MTWGPQITLRWGPYQKLDPDDQQKIVKVANDAYEAKAITERQRAVMLAPVFGIEDIDAHLDALAVENEERENEAAEEMYRSAGMNHKDAAAKAGSTDDAEVAELTSDDAPPSSRPGA